MKPKVILADGPLRGEVREVDSPHVRTMAFPLMCPFPFTETTVGYEPDLSQVIYQIHRMRLFGEWLLIGSIGFMLPGDRDLFEALASNAAKDAALW